MSRRSYGQYCPFAKALDVVGDRWTLLVIRELLGGPRRYTDLLNALEGIGTNLLADRLKRLEAHGVLRRRDLPPPTPATVYELTDVGEELRELVYGFARWGTRFMGSPDETEVARSHWLALGMLAVADHEAAAGVHDIYEFRVDDEVFHVVVDDGDVEIGDGPAEQPDAVFEGDPKRFLGIAAGYPPSADDVAAGRVRIKGDPDAVARSARIFGGR